MELLLYVGHNTYNANIQNTTFVIISYYICVEVYPSDYLVSFKIRAVTLCKKGVTKAVILKRRAETYLTVPALIPTAGTNRNLGIVKLLNCLTRPSQ